jgi:tetratricopeptide (TPR) repeat protein
MRVGPYELLRTIGEGGMGHVYAARGPGDVEVAVKVLQGGGSEVAARFERERRLLASLGESDGFVPLLDAGAVPGGAGPAGAYIVMPLMGGGTLRAKLARGPLGADATIELGRALAAALGAAHARGIVHRDMKPENVLFTTDGRPLVADLGLAKHFDRGKSGASQSVSLSQGDTFRGTAGYMAPEQATDAKNVGPAADVFSLGVILYECLAGEPPFVGETFLDAMTKVMAGDFVPLRERAPDAPAWLAAAVERALADDPADRFGDGLAVARALDAAAPGGQTFALPVAAGVLALLAGIALALSLRAEPKRAPPAPPPPRPHVVQPPAPTAGELLTSAGGKLRQSDWSGAAADFTRSIERDPGIARAWSGRALARERLGDHEGAIADATKSIELAPDVGLSWSTRGRCRRARGDLEGAIEDFTRALALDPRDAESWGNRGAAKLASHDYTGAIEDCGKAVELDPRQASAWACSGTARMARTGDDARALADLDRALELDPKLIRAHSLRGLLRAKANDREGALADLDAYLAVATDDGPETRTIREQADALRKLPVGSPEATKLLDAGHAKEAAGDREGAIRDYTRVTELAPGLMAGWSSRGLARFATKDMDGALADFTRALEIEPRNAGLFGLRATVRVQKGDWAGVVEDTTRTIELGPATLTQPLIERSGAREKLGDHDGAIEDLTRVLEKEPRNTGALVRRGLLRARWVGFDAARPDLERFLELAPDDPNAASVRGVIQKGLAEK